MNASQCVAVVSVCLLAGSCAHKDREGGTQASGTPVDQTPEPRRLTADNSVMTDQGEAQLVEDIVSSMIESLGQAPVLWTMPAKDDGRYQMFSTLDRKAHSDLLTKVLTEPDQMKALTPWRVGADLGIVEVQSTLERWVQSQHDAVPNADLRLVIVGPAAFQAVTISALTVPDGIQVMAIGE